MSPAPDRPGAISTGIDIALVVIILGCLGVLLHCAYRVVAGGVKAAARWRRRRRAWLRGGGDDE